MTFISSSTLSSSVLLLETVGLLPVEKNESMLVFSGDLETLLNNQLLASEQLLLSYNEKQYEIIISWRFGLRLKSVVDSGGGGGERCGRLLVPMLV